MIWRKELNEPKNKDQLIEETAECILAPALLDFVRWVLKEAQERGKKRLYFMARDGYLMYRPAILSYDLKNGENCCKEEIAPVPKEYEVVSSEVLEMWSAQLMENWNLYKQEREKKGGRAAPAPRPPAVPSGFEGIRQQELEERT